MDLNRDVADARPTVPYWAAASLAAAAATITWWFTSDSDSGDFYMIGPYQLPLWFEYLVGGTAIAMGAAALHASTKPTQARGAVMRSTTVVLVLTAMMTTGLWRVMTDGVTGANIGGGMAAFAGPFLIATALFLALCVQRFNAGMRTRTFIRLSVLTLGTGPILFATIWYGLAP